VADSPAAPPGTVPGVVDARTATTLEDSYARSRELTKSLGLSYYAATLTLPRVTRHHVQALYGFCRYAGDVVGAVPRTNVQDREQALADLGDALFGDLAAGGSDDPVLKAVVHTARSFDLDPDCFRRFLRAMTTSLTITSYDTFDDLLDYMDGSAAVIGELVLPILEPRSDEVVPAARDFAIACRLTDCLANIAHDLERGRLYVPREDLRTYGANPWLRRVTPEWRALMAFEIRRTRQFFDATERVIVDLPPRSARCVCTVRDLHTDVLDRIERAGGDVFAARVEVPYWRAAEVVARRVLAGAPSTVR
jgi:phytoene synthase